MAWIREDLGATATTRAALASPEAAALDDLPLYVHEAAHARPWPSHPKMIAIAYDIFAPYAEKAIVGELSPEEAMDQASREAQELIEGKR